MGGADPDNVTLKVIQALGRLSGDAWEGYAARMGTDFRREIPHAVTKLARLAEALERNHPLENSAYLETA